MSQQSPVSVAVAGATGAVGEVMLELLGDIAARDWEIRALASERSLGRSLACGKRRLKVEVLDSFDFSGVDYALFSAGASVSRVHAARAAEQGCIVIDNTSEFRYRDDIRLVVPEVNGQLLDDVEPGTIIANPNCSTIQMVVAVAPIHRAAGIARINVATYQSVSGAGRSAMEELARQTAERLNMREVTPRAFKQPIAFNVLPEIDVLQDNGYTKEEMKLHWETRKILDDASIMVNATAVRVPVFFGHAEAVHLETREAIEIEAVAELLRGAPGVVVVEPKGKQRFATPVTHAAGKDPVFVSRLRRDLSHPRGIDLWVVADNVRKGAALNAVQIMQRLRSRAKG
jgi:aspartate-semialdehyde dehydrogenase